MYCTGGEYNKQMQDLRVFCCCFFLSSDVSKGVPRQRLMLTMDYGALYLRCRPLWYCAVIIYFRGLSGLGCPNSFHIFIARYLILIRALQLWLEVRVLGAKLFATNLRFSVLCTWVRQGHTPYKTVCVYSNQDSCMQVISTPGLVLKATHSRFILPSILSTRVYSWRDYVILHSDYIFQRPFRSRMSE